MTLRGYCVLVAMLFEGVSVLTLSGCGAGPVYHGRSFSVDASGIEHERMIGVIRQVLDDHRFEIDRVDSRRGVVSTTFKSTQGFASPWDTEQGSFREEVADFVNQHERAVRVQIGQEGSVEVSVLVRRVNRPGWRIETESINQSTHARMLDSAGKREPVIFTGSIGTDGQLAERIGIEITRRLGGG